MVCCLLSGNFWHIVQTDDMMGLFNADGRSSVWQPVPKRRPQTVRPNASSFKLYHLLCSLRSSGSCLSLLRRLLVSSSSFNNAVPMPHVTTHTALSTVRHGSLNCLNSLTFKDAANCNLYMFRRSLLSPSSEWKLSRAGKSGMQ
jgi:hypothetical protein